MRRAQSSPAWGAVLRGWSSAGGESGREQRHGALDAPPAADRSERPDERRSQVRRSWAAGGPPSWRPRPHTCSAERCTERKCQVERPAGPMACGSHGRNTNGSPGGTTSARPRWRTAAAAAGQVTCQAGWEVLRRCLASPARLVSLDPGDMAPVDPGRVGVARAGMDRRLPRLTRALQPSGSRSAHTRCRRGSLYVSPGLSPDA